MRPISKTQGIAEIRRIKREFDREIREHFEHRAKSCSTCDTPGACCLDEHFVNVHISELEAEAIGQRLSELPTEMRQKVSQRTKNAIEKYGLTADSADFERTYACPLFEKGIGCLVHGDNKPLPCISHACYERKEDLPPEHLLSEREAKVDKLNEMVFGKPTPWLPIPIAIDSFSKPA